MAKWNFMNVKKVMLNYAIFDHDKARNIDALFILQHKFSKDVVMY